MSATTHHDASAELRRVLGSEEGEEESESQLRAELRHRECVVAAIDRRTEELRERLEVRARRLQEAGEGSAACSTSITSTQYAVYGRHPSSLANELLSAARDPQAFQAMAEELMRRKGAASEELMRLTKTPGAGDVVIEPPPAAEQAHAEGDMVL